MAQHVKLTHSQKEEIRRLTQKANRRIKSFIKTYEKAGYKTIPKEVTAGFDVQTQKQFKANNYALSRSVKFDSKEDYQRHLKQLRRFESGRADSVPTVSEYNRVSRQKLLQAFETSDVDVSSALKKKISKMTAAEIRSFWSDYQIRARRKGLQYASDAVILETATNYEAWEETELLRNTLKGR